MLSKLFEAISIAITSPPNSRMESVNSLPSKPLAPVTTIVFQFKLKESFDIIYKIMLANLSNLIF